MKSAFDHPFAELETAARKLIEIANIVEATLDGRIHIELINLPFLPAAPTNIGWASRVPWVTAGSGGNESGVYVKSTPAGANLFA